MRGTSQVDVKKLAEAIDADGLPATLLKMASDLLGISAQIVAARDSKGKRPARRRNLGAVAALILLGASTARAGGILDVSGLADLVASKAKEVRACSTVYGDADVTGGGYLSVWTFHAAGNPTGIFALGVGGEANGHVGRPLFPAVVNLPELSSRLWSSTWAQDHLTRTKLPPIWFGPVVRPPTGGEIFTWRDARRFVGLMVSIAGGGGN